MQPDISRLNQPMKFLIELQQQLEGAGCVARQRGNDTLEVWETNLSEHYLIQVHLRSESPYDIVQIVG